MVLALGLIAGATLIPADAVPGSGPRTACVLCGTRGTADLILNLLLFAPLGAAMRLRGLSALRIVLIAGLLAGSIELAQLAIPGRNPGWRDVATNVFGASLGIMLLRAAPAFVAADQRATRRFASSIAGGLLALLGTGIALQPVDGAPPFYGQWAPRLGHLAAWEGRVTSASLGGTAIPDGPWVPTDSVAQLLALNAPLEIRAVPGTPPERLAPIIAIADERQQHLLMLGQSRGDAIVSVARRAQGWRLDAPSHVVPGFFSGLSPEKPFALTLSNGRELPCLRLDGRTACATRFAAGSLWTLLLWDVSWPRILTRGLDALSFALIFLPAAMLLFRIQRAAALVGSLAICVGALATTWSVGLALPSAWEWLALGILFALGAWRGVRAPAPIASGD